MQEHQVTIGHDTFKVPSPFLVLATQNPIETEGTYALPEAQVDRFMLKVLVGYPSPTEEFAIVERMTGRVDKIQPVLSTDDLVKLQETVDAVYVDPALIEYAVRLTNATRSPQLHGMAELERRPAGPTCPGGWHRGRSAAPGRPCPSARARESP